MSKKEDKTKKKVETRKDEVRFFTSDQREMVGKFLTENVHKTWTEDFIDQDTGEVVSVERKEIIFEGGNVIDQELAAKIAFSIQAQEIEGVEVSNQRRCAQEYGNSWFRAYMVNFSVSNSKFNLLLQAQGINKALEVARDYIELNFGGYFHFNAVKAMDEIIIIPYLLRKIETDSEKEEREAIAPEAGAEAEGTEEKNIKLDNSAQIYYKVEATLSFKSSIEDEKPRKNKYIVRAKSAELATDIVIAYIKMREEEKKTEKTGLELESYVVNSVSTISCDCIVDLDFCLAYKEDIKESY